MNLTIRQNAVTVWAGAEHTQTSSGFRNRQLSGFFTPMIFYGRVACNYKIPFVGKLQARLDASVQVPDHPFAEHRGITKRLGVENMSNSLSIGSISIRQTDGLYSLNDLHKASGGLDKHKPSNFLRVDQTQALIKEIEQVSDMSLALKVKHGGHSRGTYVCKEIAIAYAMWVSAYFMLVVIRTFDAVVNPKPQIESKSNLADAPQNLSASRSFALALMENGARKYDEITSAYGQLLKNLENVTENLNKVIGQVNHVKKMIHHIDHNDGAVHDGFAEARLYLFMDKDIKANAKPIAQKLYKPLDFKNI